MWERASVCVWERVQDQAWLGRKGDPLGILQEIEFWTFECIVMHKRESTLDNETHNIFGNYVKKIVHWLPAEEKT